MSNVVRRVPYLSGLDLDGRSVVVVGGGSVAARRLHRLLASGARVTVVSPVVQTAVEGLAAAGRITWVRRDYAPGDLDGAWYAMAATDRSGVNAAVIAEAESRRVFCVRADRGEDGSAMTPAVGSGDGIQFGVLAGGDHRRSGQWRDVLQAAVDSPDPGGRPPVEHAPDRRGTVAIVGGGPGDPQLITVRGAQLLASADVVVVDRLAPGELLDGVRRDAEIVDASKIPHGRSMDQEIINETLVTRARQGRFVVRLKGGDPFVFGRGYEEVQALAEAAVPAVVVPGVSSALAGPALAGIPLTHRSLVHEAVIVSGHVPPGHSSSLVDWGALGRLRGTVVVLMGVTNAAAISKALIAGGRLGGTPVAVVSNASTPRQRRIDTTLAGLGATVEGRWRQGDAAKPTDPIRPPAVIVIGEVAGLP